MLKKIIAMTTLICSVSSISHAQTIPQPPSLQPGEVNVGAAVSPMKKGQVAPYTGVLLSPEVVANVVARFDSFEKEVQIEVKRERQLAEAACSAQLQRSEVISKTNDEIHLARIEAREKQIEILNEALRDAESSASSTPIWAGLGTLGGFVVGAGTTLLAVIAASAVRN